MRFDDSLSTVLAAGTTPGAGAGATWRQLVDLAGRRRMPAEAALERLATLRAGVPLAVRVASARALAAAEPETSLVAFFADDDIAVARPVLRAATLSAGAWLDLLPRLSPAARAVLRGRRDLPDAAVRGLASLGAVDFTLPAGEAAIMSRPSPAAVEVPAVEEEATATRPVINGDGDGEGDWDGDWDGGNASLDMGTKRAADRGPPPTPPAAPLSPTPFLAVGEVARSLPVVAEALRRSEDPAATPRFEIADIVARIDAFRRDAVPPPLPAPVPAPAGFRFVTDAAGTIRWIDGVGRACLVGVSLAHAHRQGLAQVDAGVAGAVRARQRFADARLEVDGASDAAGSWRIAAVPAFERASGRFTGYHGAARRPARHEAAAPVSDQLRQLVHELRTPANAVSGFAELIETELLGPVPPVHRARAAAIRSEAGQLLAAIDDLDTAARIEGGALDLRPMSVPLAPLIDRIVDDLRPLATVRGATLRAGGERATVLADDRAVERLLARLLSALVAAAAAGETIGLDVRRAGGAVVIAFDRPRALADVEGDALFALDDEAVAGGPLLGAGFTLRLVRNLAAELGGAFAIAPDGLTLRLPDALIHDMGQAATR